MAANDRSRLRAVDLFCGSGAVTTGLSGAFDVVAAVDHDATACLTYAANHPGVRLFERDITTLDPAEVLKEVPDAANVDLLIVCAPCQPFSNQNQRKEADPRATLILQAARYAEACNPKGILFENVPGLAGAAGVYEDLARAMAAVGYVVGKPRKVNAADLGVPQRRIRCVMFAARSEDVVARFEGAKPSAARKTVADAIRDLVPLESGEVDPGDHLHAARRHAPIALRRLRAIPRDGGSRASLPPELRLKCHETTHGYPDVYGRMAWNDVAPTLTTGCTDVTRGRFGHPEQDRAITLREAALLQTFPPKYVFHGAYKEVATQIGNAVPVAMVAAMVPALVAALAAA
ncbi:DNA cytosine methyltransferase [Methylobacterium sp. 092160098-2]|uniref:DNA cytosine methyltransferase n=1 Tax=Methylobacterium sp. 092160098-2 TaxID=3025129 RepID=UPI002381AE3D|nr:DNA cytosine methyltransferase [Methylobacterium sp. 092160098-2]MDE4911235.1 DNA cytosine methyltransferase [Methylobacterium sp. 092160098-2]